MSRILRALRTCGLIIVLSITLVLAVTAYILFSSAPGARQSVTVPTVAGSETRQGEAENSRESRGEARSQLVTVPTVAGSETRQGEAENSRESRGEARSQLVTATPIPPTTALLFVTSTPIPVAETPIAPSSPTSIPPSATPVPPSRTPLPPTATPVLPTRTPIPPSRTLVPTAASAFNVNRYSSPQTRYTHGTVNLRKGPGTSYDRVGSASVNAALQVIGKSGDWYLIRHNGREVFIAGWLTHSSRLVQPSRQQTSGSSSQPAVSQPPQQPAQQPVQQPAARVQEPVQQPAQQQPRFSCSPRKNCGDMSSCAEARFHLTQCGRGALDRDKDGVPCESICR